MLCSKSPQITFLSHFDALFELQQVFLTVKQDVETTYRRRFALFFWAVRLLRLGSSKLELFLSCSTELTSLFLKIEFSVAQHLQSFFCVVNSTTNMATNYKNNNNNDEMEPKPNALRPRFLLDNAVFNPLYEPFSVSSVSWAHLHRFYLNLESPVPAPTLCQFNIHLQRANTSANCTLFSLSVEKQAHLKKKTWVSPSLHKGDFELSKLQSHELWLSDMIETRSGTRQPPRAFAFYLWMPPR